MKNKLKDIFELYKEFPEVVFSMLMLSKVLMQKSDVVKKNRSNKIINILGNGPSGIETYSNSKKRDEELMCVNYFALTESFLKFKPEHYTLIDPVYFLDLNEKNLELIKVLNTVSWNLKLYIPSKYKSKYLKLISNKNIDVKVIRFNYLPGRNKFTHFLYSKNLATPKFQNVLVSCIYIALNRGFFRINLHGVEANEFTNFIVNEKNEVLLETQHSYGNNIRNMFLEGRISKGEFWKYLMHYANMLKGFYQIKSYSKYIGTNIFNYTKTSYIDSFDKV